MQALETARGAVATRGYARYGLQPARSQPIGTTCDRPAWRNPVDGAASPATKRRNVFMFSGEGSQHFQMGRALFESSALFESCMHEMDEIVQALSGYSVVHLLYEQSDDGSEAFDRTLLSHPAIFMVQYATSRVLMRAGVRPDVTIGTGVGAFAAAAVANHFGMEDALLAVIRQASMFEACCVRGGMLAVRLDTDAYEASQFPDCEIASSNQPGGFVIAAPQDALSGIEDSLRSKGIASQKLAVPFAFHSRWIDAAKCPFQSFMQSVARRSGTIPMMCSLRAEWLTELPEDYLWRAMREPVRLADAIERLESAGPFHYVDVGPSASPAWIATRTLASAHTSTAQSILTPSDRGPENITGLSVRGV